MPFFRMRDNISDQIILYNKLRIYNYIIEEYQGLQSFVAPSVEILKAGPQGSIT